ncbi:Peptidoglycan-N-acetylglucosamine deacetylase [Folsomia candida]|uniref:Peptidoglycan-N-acetylglucosamine deacetylase n=1 Tax=Folsomia candida TaxID=158441 RepID=A0A226E2W0_FOLCA|nr:Peptidoglycan-N-acetylglucosamine deacetylase [Folsomia candida]
MATAQDSLAFIILVLSVSSISGQDLKVWYNCTLPNQYALTFDDGPHPTQTAQVLDLLLSYNVTATFFLIGVGIWEADYERYQQSVRRAYREGHQIGNHGWSHPDMRNITEDEIRSELSGVETLIYGTIGVRPTIFRPPYGEYNQKLVRVAKEEFNYEVIMWNIDTLVLIRVAFIVLFQRKILGYIQILEFYSWDWSHPGDTEAGMEEYYSAINSTLHHNYIALHHDVQGGAVNLAATAIEFMVGQGFELSPTSTIVLHFLIFPKKSNHPLLHKMRGFSIIFVALMATATVYGADYGELCNGLLLQCNRYSETVLCMSRTRNETVGGEVCQVGVDVDLGRCQCRRNCGSGGVYILDGEFDTTRQKCVGFVEKSCQVYPDCTANAYCEPVLRVCKCSSGFSPTPDGLRCA